MENLEESHHQHSVNLNTADNSNTTSIAPKTKVYRTKNSEWYCKPCDIYCNSDLQFEVHMMSQKHKSVVMDSMCQADGGPITSEDVDKIQEKTLASHKALVDENNNHIKAKNDNIDESFVDGFKENLSFSRSPKSSFSSTDIKQNPIAIQCNVNAEKYLIPEAKKIGKYEKFGFYCSMCDAFMTGQIQLIMHVKGAKHQYYCPNEIPGYKPSKVFNPNVSSHNYHKNRQGASHYNGNTKSIPFPYISSSDSLLRNAHKISNYLSLQHKQQQQYQQHQSLHHINGTYNEYLIKNHELMNTNPNANFNNRYYSNLNGSSQSFYNNSSTSFYQQLITSKNQHDIFNQLFSLTSNTPTTPSTSSHKIHSNYHIGDNLNNGFNSNQPSYFNNNASSITNGNNTSPIAGIPAPYQILTPTNSFGTSPTTNVVINSNNIIHNNNGNSSNGMLPNSNRFKSQIESAHDTTSKVKVNNNSSMLNHSFVDSLSSSQHIINTSELGYHHHYENYHTTPLHHLHPHQHSTPAVCQININPTTPLFYTTTTTNAAHRLNQTNGAQTNQATQQQQQQQQQQQKSNGNLNSLQQQTFYINNQ